MKILLTGGNGTLGQELQKLLKKQQINYEAPSKKELDITEKYGVYNYLCHHQFDYLIHCAAYTDVAKAEIEKEKCWKINVEGTQNLFWNYKFFRKKVVYISTEYVFDGEKGMYKENDIPNPVNFYSLTKLCGEMIAGMTNNGLIIRTSFAPNWKEWKYKAAIFDQFSGKTWVRNIAPHILKAVLHSTLRNTVIHITGKRKRIYDLAKQISPNISMMVRKAIPVKLPYDTSLNCSNYETFFNTII